MEVTWKEQKEGNLREIIFHKRLDKRKRIGGSYLQEKQTEDCN